MRKIDPNTWPRRDIFDFFSKISNPFYSVTFNVDVTEAYAYAKRRGLSFYYALVYLVTRAINSVEAFRYALVDGELVLLDERSPSFTDLKKGSESLHIVTMPCKGDIAEFCFDAKRRSAEQTTFLSTDKEGADLIYISCLPWIELTALTNERDFDPDDAIPRVSWGKFHERDGRKILGMSLELNHRFTDGVHIGKFAEALENLISQL
ncbi:MAG: CatA-like O-acetyltransferase [Firmicutes bacterium]|nr:CatA-like O-acetyltransferase [Bacillota bacterium]